MCQSSQNDRIRNPKRNVTTGSVESRTVAKSLFNSLEVVSLPALFRPLLLVVRDAPTLDLQLRLTAPIQEAHGDSCVMLCEAQMRSITKRVKLGLNLRTRLLP